MKMWLKNLGLHILEDFKWFIKEMLDPAGKISAPQTMGTALLLAVPFIIWAAIKYPVMVEVLKQVLTASVALLTAGTVEVYGKAKYGNA